VKLPQVGCWNDLIARIQVAALESRQPPEPVQIVNPDAPLSQCEQILLAQLTENAVDMNGGQTQRIV